MESDAYGASLFAHTEALDRPVAQALDALATRRGVPHAQLALAWVLQGPGVTAPIIGASKPRHLLDAVAALDVQLSPDEVAELQAPYQAHPVVGYE